MRNFILNYWLFLLPIVLFTYSCKKNQELTSIETWKQEIMETEALFAEMASKEGIPIAFEAFASEEAVLMRNNNLIIGKTEMKRYFETQKASLRDVKLSWKPDFVEVATSGDLGYTYGQYKLAYKDSSGVIQESIGIFHTVWKRQSDNSWKFVWD